MAQTLAIDFGTSNSAAGILEDGKLRLLEIENGRNTLPTSVFFDFNTRKTLFGTPANLSLIQGREGRFMRSLKSVLGTSLMHEKRWIMGQEMDFVDIIGHFISTLKNHAEQTLGTRFDAALAGRPVHFHSEDKIKDQQALNDLTQCYERAGFREVGFMLEPEAAARANGGAGNVGKVGLIVDIGGGTSDFTLFRGAKDGGIQVLASHGVRVGGTDFDQVLSLHHVMPLFGKGALIGREMGPGTMGAPNWIFNELATWQKIPFLYTGQVRADVAVLEKLAIEKRPFQRLGDVLENELGHDVAFAVERGKIMANSSDDGQAIIDLGPVEPELNAVISAQDLANSLADHAEKIRTCAQETLALSGFDAAQVDRVIFVGGSSLMAVIESAMDGLFPNARLEYGDAFTAIIDGLTLASDENR